MTNPFDDTDTGDTIMDTSLSSLTQYSEESHFCNVYHGMLVAQSIRQDKCWIRFQYK